MQLAGDGAYGPSRDRDEALQVLRAAIAAGVDHIDTAQPERQIASRREDRVRLLR